MSTAPRPEAAERHGPTIRLIQEAVGAQFNLPRTELLSARRSPSVSLARRVGYWLACRHTKKSTPEIGAHFGGRDHSTIILGRDAINRRLKAGDRDLTTAIAAIETALGVSDIIISGHPGWSYYADLDPLEISARVLDAPAPRVSQDDLRAMAGCIRHHILPLVERDEVEADLSPASDSDPSLDQLIRAAIEAGRALEAERFQRGEAAAIDTAIRTLKQLSTAFEPLSKGA